MGFTGSAIPDQAGDQREFLNNGGSLGRSEPVNLCGHDEVAFRKTVDLVSPQGNSHLAPGKKDVGMVSFGFGDLSHAVHKSEGLLEIGKAEFPLEMMFVCDRPVRDSQVKILQFLSAKRGHAASAWHAFFVS